MANDTTIQARINIMATEFANGLGNSQILAKYGKTWGIGLSCIEMYSTRAKELARTNIVDMFDASMQAYKDAEVKILKDRIIDKFQRMVILSDIAMGNLVIEKTQSLFNYETKTFESVTFDTLPDEKSRMKAIEILNTMDGSNAPAKSRFVNENDEDVTPLINKIEIVHVTNITSSTPPDNAD